MTIEGLYEIAIANIDRSYSPYSHFRVSVALMTESGEVYTGVNVENVSFSLSICAERVAIFNAITNGDTDIVAIAIFHDGVDMPFPCGACLQVMSEFNPNLQLIIGNEYQSERYQLGELFPKSFVSTELDR